MIASMYTHVTEVNINREKKPLKSFSEMKKKTSQYYSTTKINSLDNTQYHPAKSSAHSFLRRHAFYESVVFQ